MEEVKILTSVPEANSQIELFSFEQKELQKPILRTKHKKKPQTTQRFNMFSTAKFAEIQFQAFDPYFEVFMRPSVYLQNC